jgi:hypothetical protein
MSKVCPKKNQQNNPAKINQTQKWTTNVVNDREEISDAETEQMAVEVNKTNKKTSAQVNKMKMMPGDVAKAIAALSQEE